MSSQKGSGSGLGSGGTDAILASIQSIQAAVATLPAIHDTLAQVNGKVDGIVVQQHDQAAQMKQMDQRVTAIERKMQLESLPLKDVPLADKPKQPFTETEHWDAKYIVIYATPKGIKDAAGLVKDLTTRVQTAAGGTALIHLQSAHIFESKKKAGGAAGGAAAGAAGGAADGGQQGAAAGDTAEARMAVVKLGDSFTRAMVFKHLDKLKAAGYGIRDHLTPEGRDLRFGQESVRRKKMQEMKAAANAANPQYAEVQWFCGVEILYRKVEDNKWYLVDWSKEGDTTMGNAA